MTQINCVPPQDLDDSLLAAEWEEFPKLYQMIEDAVERGEAWDDPSIPEKYTLGEGNLLFFYNKLAWLLHRQYLVFKVMKDRELKPKFKPGFDPAYKIPLDRYRWWKPSENDLELNQKMLNERVSK